MKKEPYYQLDYLKNDLLREKQKLSASLPHPQSQLFFSSSKKIIAQNNNIQPGSTFQFKQLYSMSKNQQNPNRTNQFNQQLPQNPQRVKASSFHEKTSNQSKMQYLGFAQKQYREERKNDDNKEKMPTSQESENRMIKEQIVNLKNRMEKYFMELQKKDEMIISRQKEVIEKNKIIGEANERIRGLEQEHANCQTKNQHLYEQYMLSQKDKEYYVQLQDNYRIISQKCTQLEHILQQKDQYIQNIINSKENQYNSLCNSKNYEIRALEERINILQTENGKLLTQSNRTQNKPLVQAQPINICKFQAMGQQFEAKTNHYITENTRLKNELSHYEGEVEQLRIHRDSLENTLKAYEQRDNMEKSSRLEEQLMLLRDELERQNQQKDSLVSKHELEVLKLQNQLASKKLQLHSNLIDLYDQERLHQNLYLALEEVERLKARLKKDPKGPK